jgi:hypothetical protein
MPTHGQSGRLTAHAGSASGTPPCAVATGIFWWRPREAWNEDEHSPVWSAFAPVRDSQDRGVAILGVDYPAPEVLKHPEWNRDSNAFIPR